MATSMSRGNAPDFALCGLFTGKTGQSAARWLKKVEWELKKHAGDDGSVDPSRFLRAVNLLLADDAAAWAETTPGIVELLEHPAPNADTVAQFKGLFNQRYPSKVPEPSVVHFDSEISNLRQKDDEALVTYYQRTTSLLSRVGGQDRPREITPSTPALSPLEAAMLDTVMRAFTRGIRDLDIRRDALRGLVSSDRSLYRVYSISEESRRAKGEYIHLQEEATKAQELQFYREVVQRNMPLPQINSLKVSFHAQYMPQWGYSSQPTMQWTMQWPTPTLTPAYLSAPLYVSQPFQQPTPTPAPAPEPAPAPYQPQAVCPPPDVPSVPSVPSAPSALFVPPAPSALFTPSALPPAQVPPLPAVMPALSAPPPAVSVRSITYGVTGLRVSGVESNRKLNIKSNVVSNAKSTQVSNVMSNIELNRVSNVKFDQRSNMELNKCAYVDAPALPPALLASPPQDGKTAIIALLTKSWKIDKEEEEPG